MTFLHGRSTTVTTDKGDVRGFLFNGVYHFWGLDYAYADRYEVPRECEPWEGYKEATNYGFICPPSQYNRIGNHIKNPYRFWPISDHCQNLNVWTRDIDPSRKKPVVFWIHGGGFNDGSSLEHQAYDGFNLANEYDLCVVTINHRLNCLGYLDLSSFGEEFKRSVNLGNLDIIMALKWVRRNIERFGGDPDNVTVYGQSGGGAKICSLMNMPEAEGLFHKAMIMSGCSDVRAYNDERNTDEVVKRALEILGIDIQGIKTVNHHKLIDAINQACKELDFGRMRFAPKKNEDFLGDPIINGYSEWAKTIPVIIGTNFSEFATRGWKYKRNEMSEEEQYQAVVDKYGKDKADRLLKIFREVFPDKKTIDLLAYQHLSYRAGSKEMIRARAKAGFAPIYNYLFAPTTGIDGGSTPVHSYDIPFMFHNTALIPSCDLGGDYTEKLDKTMSGRFASFARYGNPNIPGDVVWEPCTEGNIPTLIFDRVMRVCPNYDEELVKIINE